MKMKTFDIYFKDDCVITRHAEDKYTIIAELHDEFPNREIDKVVEIEGDR